MKIAGQVDIRMLKLIYVLHVFMHLEVIVQTKCVSDDKERERERERERDKE